MELKQTERSFFYPPGGLLIWIVIYLELLTFGMAIIALAYYGVQQRALFSESAAHLNKTLATINTLLLLTSGYFMAQSITAFKRKNTQLTLKFINFSILTGFGFIILKAIEYYDKIEAGLTMDYNSFFMFYWLLTGFHWIHVLVGLVILLFLRKGIQRKRVNYNFEDLGGWGSFLAHVRFNMVTTFSNIILIILKMRNQTTISYLILLVLTTLTAIIASNKVLIVAVILTAIVKFWLVAFQFMELKKAHTFWKFSILLFGTLMGLSILILFTT